MPGNGEWGSGTINVSDMFKCLHISTVKFMLKYFEFVEDTICE
jgi:hypothetical protein